MAVATRTRTLVINPAFLQEIKDSNPDLWIAAGQLQQIDRLNDQPVRILRELTKQLDELRDQLALQFSLEECYGYIDLPESASATVSRLTCDLARRTQSQHATLYLNLSELAEQAEELQYRGVELHRLRDLIQWTRDFSGQLNEHEQLEKELIRRCYERG